MAATEKLGLEVGVEGFRQFLSQMASMDKAIGATATYWSGLASESKITNAILGTIANTMRELVGKFDDLSQESEEAADSTEKLGDEEEKTEKKTKKFAIALGVVGVALRSTLAKGASAAIRSLRKLWDIFKKVARAAVKVTVSLAKIAFKAVVGGAIAATAAVVGLAAGIVKLALDAAPMKGVEDAFRGIAEASGQSADDVLAALKRGSLGMITQRELMESYNTAAQLVGTTFANQLPDAMGYLSKVAAATGQDMGFMMDSLVKGVGRLSPMILDNLGIQVALSEATEEAANMFGVEASELTKAQTQAGMMNVVLAKLEENTAAMPEVVGTATQQIASFKTMLKDTGDRVGVAFVPALQALMGPMGEIAGGVGERLIEWAERAGRWLGEELPIAIEKLGAWFEEHWPAIQEKIENLRDTAKRVIDWWVENWPLIQANLEEMWTAIQPVLEDLAAWFTDEGPGALEDLKATFEEVWTFIQKIVDKAVKWFEENLPLIQETGETLVAFWEDHIAPALDNVWEIIKEIVDLAINSVLDTITLVMQVITGDWEGAWETVKGIASDIWESIKKIVSEFVEGVANAVGTTTEEIKETWRTNWEMVKLIVSTIWNNMIEAIKEKIQTVYDNIVAKIEEIKDTWETIWESIKLIVSTIWDNIITAVTDKIQEVYNAITDKIGEIKTWLGNQVSALKDIGADLINGMKEGVLGAVSGLIAAVKGAIADAIAAAKDVLWAHSESKVFKQLGRETMASMAKGIAEFAPIVQAQIQAAVSPVPSAGSSITNVTQNYYNLTTQSTTRPGALRLEFEAMEMVTR